MELEAGKVAVVTGAASGIGLALARRFAGAGLSIVLADIETGALEVAEREIAELGVPTLAVVTDVSSATAVEALAQATVDRFGGVHLVCNNAGVGGFGDAWLGPIETWDWVLGVNLWGVIHGCRAFLPRLIASGGGHIVNTASIAGLYPGIGPTYDASKHAVVALTENLHFYAQTSMLPVGVSVLCPGFVRTNILDSGRNFAGDPAVLERDQIGEVTFTHAKRAIDEGMQPAMVADQVADAIVAGKFWILPDKAFKELAIARWATIADELNPVPASQWPGMAPFSQIAQDVMSALGIDSPTS